MYIFRRSSSYLSVNFLRSVRLIQKTKSKYLLENGCRIKELYSPVILNHHVQIFDNIQLSQKNTNLW